jgi:5-methylthioadenosine/S-adenosylhomocysteine deaminase
MRKVLIEVGAVIQSASQVLSEPSYLYIEDGVIREVGPGPYSGPTNGVTVFRRPHSVAIPGLVNAHGHAAMTLLRGAGDDVPLMTWLQEKVFPLEAKLTHEAIYWGTMLACWEMIRSGTTCFTDMYFMMHDAARAVAESGMRGVLSWGMVGLDDASRTNGINNSRAFVAQWHNQADGRITVTLGPHAPYTCPPDYLAETAELSAELGVPIQIHLSETKVEVDNSYAEHGKSPIAHALACGLFNRPVLAAHCVHVSDEDIAIMKEHDVRVAHNPQSNLKLASGIAPVVKMKAAGLTVGLGTDGAASNNNLDMFEELRLAATLHKGVLYDATVIPAAEAFAMATADSARAVFLPDGHGTLTPGAAADVTLLDLDSPHFQPTFDLLSNVVYASGADDVTDVFVAGSPLLLNREPVTLDTERIRYEVRKIEELLKR